MKKYPIPVIFQKLISEDCLKDIDIVNTQDGFYLAYKSLADILAEKNILDFPGNNGKRLMCDRFFDDWFLYAVPSEEDCTYSFLKFREQEHDAEEGLPADGDTPGVTISFISIACEILLTCLLNPSDENRMKLDEEINRVVARRGQRHHKDLKRYFADPRSEGSYLVAATYIKHIASFTQGGYLEVPQHYKETVNESAWKKHSKHRTRLPRFVAAVNQNAGYVVCDNERIYIQNSENPTAYESAIILATHTGNTSFFSFAAEVQFHARFLTRWAKIPVPGGSPYASAIRADMSIGDADFAGPTPYYRPDSRIVRKQYHCHKDNV